MFIFVKYSNTSPRSYYPNVNMQRSMVSGYSTSNPHCSSPFWAHQIPMENSDGILTGRRPPILVGIVTRQVSLDEAQIDLIYLQRLTPILGIDTSVRSRYLWSYGDFMVVYGGFMVISWWFSWGFWWDLRGIWFNRYFWCMLMRYRGDWSPWLKWGVDQPPRVFHGDNEIWNQP